MAGDSTKRARRRVGLVGAAPIALIAAGSASAHQASALTRSSTFDASNEGWIVNTGTTFTPTDWHATGGNPGGYVTGSFQPPSYGLFQSVPGSAGTTWPPGNAVGDYGGTLQADVNASDPTTDVFVGFFSSNSSVLPCADMGVTGFGWKTESLTLDTSHLVDCVTSNPLTGAQASAALAGFEAMIVAPSVTNNNSITVGLDNAQLNGPDLAVTPPTGTVARAFTLKYSAHTFKGTLTAPYDFSCASKAKVTIFRKAKKPVKVGTATTSAPNLHMTDGPTTFSFKLKKVVKGSYYASATQVKSSLDGNTCTPVKSKSVGVR